MDTGQRRQERRPVDLHADSRHASRGFSLIELIIVLAVTVILTGMMLPAMSQLRESAFRTVCSSNERQLGLALFMFAHDNHEKLPKSEALRGEKQPQELMRAYSPQTNDWDGWGLLYQYHYCRAVECYYCPSHLGEHPMERYYSDWIRPTGVAIYTNYHYSGDLEWQTGAPRRLHRGNDQILATDGLRTASDFNHGTGMNMLSGDGSVHWREGAEDIFALLPAGTIVTKEEADRYRELWQTLEVKN